MKTNLILFVALFVSIATFSQKKWTLKEAVNQALEKNISIQQNKLSLELAKKDVDIAKGNFLPNLSGSSSGRFGFGSFIDDVSNTRISTDNFNASFNLNSSVTVFNGFRNTNTFKQAKLGVETSLYDLKKIENDISLQVVDSYLNVLFAKENLEVAKIQAEISKKQIEAAEARFKAGAIAKGELLNVQSTAANDLQNVVTQENVLDLALLTLAQLLQVPSENFDVAPIELETPSTSLLYENSTIVYNKSLNYMPEIERAKLNIENADFNIKLAKGAFLPTLTAFAGMGTGYSHRFNEIFSNDYFFKQLNDNLGYNVGLSLNVPIFNRFQTKNRVAQSIINKKVSETRLENEKLQLKQTIEQAFLDVKSALKAYEAAKISLEAQQEAFKNAQERYNYGAITLFDFDLVRTRLVNAEGLMIRSKYDYVFKTKVLQFYSGELVFE
ncbi:TolC family protein [Polaribacter batillariae]|uniref:TolC family protein n=1 Tax=Polaribacter batillariae TaxID=2808900 RepID=A0ABX7SSD8_9FLAO|nr:TolC family protein [Polaribacter batillariae]QTD36574.1 TolC family protein [Polaribacter batillariae]